MITKFKLFEKNTDKNKIDVDDYVLLNINNSDKFYIDYVNYINNNIGKVLSVEYTFSNISYLLVQYDLKNIETFQDIKGYFRYLSFNYKENYYYGSNYFNINQVLLFDKDKETIMIKKNTSKYNL